LAVSNNLYRKVAKKVLSESLDLKKGETLTVESWNNGLDFARIIVAEARALGATAVLLLEDEEAYMEGVSRAPRDSLGKMGRNEYEMLQATDAYVFVPGPLLAAYQTRVNPKLMSDSTRYNRSWYEAAEKAKLRGARLTFGYVGEEMAGVAGKTIQEVVEGQLRAALVDFGEISRVAKRISSLLADGAEAELRSGESRLQFRLKGKATVEDGVVSSADVKSGDNVTYVPPGMVSIDVEPASASGTVKVSKTLTRLGLLQDAQLTFGNGRLTKWKSRNDMEMLNELVSSVPEEGRRLLGLNVGVNPKMGYLLWQDRMVAGSVTAAGFGFTPVFRGADLTVGGKQVVRGGKL